MLTDENNAFGPAHRTPRARRAALFPAKDPAALRGAFSPRRVLRRGHDVRGSHCGHRDVRRAQGPALQLASPVPGEPAQHLSPPLIEMQPVDAAAPAAPAVPAAAAAPRDHLAGLGLGLLLMAAK